MLYPYILVSIAHLYACHRQKKTLRIITKPLMMPLLALWYVRFAQSPSLLVIAALLLSFVGDMLLLPIGTPKTKALGGVAFFLGHACYVAHILPQISFPPMWLLFSMMICFGGCALFSLHGIMPHLTGIRKPAVAAYMALLYFFVMCTLVFAHDGLGAAPMFGALMFLISDTRLMREMFVEKTRYGNFIVMLTYAIAQFLLAFGFALV